MPKEKEWNHVKIINMKDNLHQHKVECKNCNHLFVANARASCIREHFLHIDPACEVVKCTV